MYGEGIWSDESFLIIYFYLFDDAITSSNKRVEKLKVKLYASYIVLYDICRLKEYNCTNYFGGKFCGIDWKKW